MSITVSLVWQTIAEWAAREWMNPGKKDREVLKRILSENGYVTIIESAEDVLDNSSPWCDLSDLIAEIPVPE